MCAIACTTYAVLPLRKKRGGRIGGRDRDIVEANEDRDGGGAVDEPVVGK